jgi:hypothetical protein
MPDQAAQGLREERGSYPSPSLVLTHSLLHQSCVMMGETGKGSPFLRQHTHTIAAGMTEENSLCKAQK